METNGRNRVYQRPRPASGGQFDQATACFHWQAGRCNRRPCGFIHSQLLIPTAQDPSPLSSKQARSLVWRRNPNPSNRTGRPDPNGGDHKRTGGPNPNGGHRSPVWRRNPNPNPVSTGGNGTGIRADGGELPSQGENKDTEKRSIGGGGVCTSKGAAPCKQLSIGDDFSLLTLLDGHQKAITGIQLPSGSNKHYSSSIDGTLKVWDCSTGQCTITVNMGGEIGCLFSDGQ